MLTKIKKVFLALSLKERVLFMCALFFSLVSGGILFSFVLNAVTTIAPARGGNYAEGMVGQPTYANPVTAESDADRSIVRLVFESAEDISEKIISENEGRVWTLRIRDGILWHDKQALTADDVLFTVEKIQDPDSRSPLARSWEGVRAERVSEREIRFNLGTPYAFFEEHLKNLYILPKHLFETIPVANWRISDYNLKPIGSGAYQFVSYATRQDGFITEYHLAPNPRYSGGEPYIGRFSFAFFSKKSDLLQGFNTGRVDGFAGIEAKDLEAIKRPYRISEYTLPNYYAVFLNQNQHLALKELAVRKALSLAVPRIRLVEEVFQGHATPAEGPIPPDSPFADAPVANASATAKYAQEILENNGWRMTEAGVLEKQGARSSKITLAFNLTVPDVPFLVDTAEKLSRAWGAIGASTTITRISLDEISDSIIKNREYQMLLFGNVLNAGSDLHSFWHSSERFYPGLNLSLYNNKEVDALIERIRGTFDEAALKEEFALLQKAIMEDYPAIFLYAPRYLAISGKEIKGLAPRFISDPPNRFTNIAEWYLETKHVLK